MRNECIEQVGNEGEPDNERNTFWNAKGHSSGREGDLGDEGIKTASEKGLGDSGEHLTEEEGVPVAKGGRNGNDRSGSSKGHAPAVEGIFFGYGRRGVEERSEDQRTRGREVHVIECESGFGRTWNEGRTPGETKLQAIGHTGHSTSAECERKPVAGNDPPLTPKYSPEIDHQHSRILANDHENSNTSKRDYADPKTSDRDREHQKTLEKGRDQQGIQGAKPKINTDHFPRSDKTLMKRNDQHVGSSGKCADKGKPPTSSSSHSAVRRGAGKKLKEAVQVFKAMMARLLKRVSGR